MGKRLLYNSTVLLLYSRASQMAVPQSWSKAPRVHTVRAWLPTRVYLQAHLALRCSALRQQIDWVRLGVLASHCNGQGIGCVTACLLQPV